MVDANSSDRVAPGAFVLRPRSYLPCAHSIRLTVSNSGHPWPNGCTSSHLSIPQSDGRLSTHILGIEPGTTHTEAANGIQTWPNRRRKMLHPMLRRHKATHTTADRGSAESPIEPSRYSARIQRRPYLYPSPRAWRLNGPTTAPRRLSAASELV
jgi:hypothetical protein